MDISIKALQSEQEIQQCAHLMANSEPWISLKRSYQDSLEILRNSEKEVYLALSNEKFAGFLILQMHGAFRGYIQTVAVMPEYRGQGIGSQFLQFAEERIFRESPNVFMCVSSFNSQAQRLYARLGYEVIGELKDYIVTGHSEILLRKTIASLSEFHVSTG